MFAIWDLQYDPDVDDQIAAHEDRGPPVKVADFVDERHPVDPGLARSDPEHGDEGQVESAEAAWHYLLEERHSEDGIWRGRW